MSQTEISFHFSSIRLNLHKFHRVFEIIWEIFHCIRYESPISFRECIKTWIKLNATIYSLFILEDLNSDHSFCGACTPATFIIRNRLLDGCLTTNIPFTLQWQRNPRSSLGKSHVHCARNGGDARTVTICHGNITARAFGRYS